MIPNTLDEFIDDLGGTSATSVLFGVKPPAVSGWRKNGKMPWKKFPLVEKICRQRRYPLKKEWFTGVENDTGSEATNAA